MAKISPKLTINDFKSKILPKASRFCKDFNWEVRKAIAMNLGTILEILN
jgi:hypothetical protein